MSPHIFLLLLAPFLLQAHAGPTVRLGAATFLGKSAGGIDSFLGIPYVKPPTGNNRLRLPQTLNPYLGEHNASTYGFACPQHAQASLDLSLLPPVTAEVVAGIIGGSAPVPQDEDCLTVNVVRPAGVSPTSKLPVLVWIHGGAWQIGSNQEQNGTLIVERSLALGEPILHVSFNYRLGGFGFLAGKEVKAAKTGNLGLHDQRAALHWVKKYISRFGGDPSKTTVHGHSAGAISIGFHMAANNGNLEGLFRGAYFLSGSTWSTDNLERGQGYYDSVASNVGCANAPDTLSCIRKKPYAQLKAAFDKLPSALSHQGFAFAFVPRVDGVFIKENGFKQIQKKLVAKIPFIQGTTDDEITLFAIEAANITTTAQVKDYLRTYFYPKATDGELDRIASLYPEDPAAGSPFDTGSVGAISPQFKRISAILTDAVFQTPRRFFMENLDGRAPAWSYVSKRFKSLPALGAFHGSDLFMNLYAGGELTDYLVHFVNHLNPNGASQGIEWPQWTASQPNLLTFYDGEPAQNITQDTFRREQISFLKKFTLENPQ